MTTRFVNTSILGLILLLTASGTYGLFFRMPEWMYEVHRVLAWGLVLLVPWKMAISGRSLGRGLGASFDRGVVPLLALLMSAGTVLVIGLGLMWAWRLGPERLWLGESTISWHWILALVIVVPFAIHAWARWPRPKRSEFVSRRGFLKLLGIGAFGLVGWRASGAVAGAREKAEEPRGASGSRLKGYFSGNDFPITTGAGDGKERIETADWSLKVSGGEAPGLVLGYEELLAMPQREYVATLDCTGGWYTVQEWRGVAVPELLRMAGIEDGYRALRLRAVSGHFETVLAHEVEEMLLATHVGNEVLSHVHGFPLRAVVPSRRGWFWVKWLAQIEALG